MDVLAGFIEERCVVKENVWTEFALLYGAYKDWCEKSGEPVQSKRKFGMRLRERGHAPDNGPNNVAIRHGIALRSDRIPPEDGNEKPGKGPESLIINPDYPDSGITAENPPPEALTPNRVNDDYLINPDSPSKASDGPADEYDRKALDALRHGNGPRMALSNYKEDGAPFENVVRSVMHYLGRRHDSVEEWEAAVIRAFGILNREEPVAPSSSSSLRTSEGDSDNGADRNHGGDGEERYGRDDETV